MPNIMVDRIMTGQLSLKTTYLMPRDHNVTGGLYKHIDASHLIATSNKPDLSNTSYPTIHQLNISP
jgi:hypothetical protein